MNVVSISGNVGREPVLRHTKSGEPTLNITVADNSPDRETSTWWNCTVFGKRAAALERYIRKGSKITVTGQVKLRQYQGQDGSPRTSLDVRVYDLALHDGREAQREEQQPRTRPTQASPRDEAWQAGSAPSQEPFDDFGDDDMPF